MNNAPFSDISKVANAAGSIFGISRNLLGGPDTIIEHFCPGGLLGEVERFIICGNHLRAIEKLAEIRQQVDRIKTHAKEIT